MASNSAITLLLTKATFLISFLLIMVITLGPFCKAEPMILSQGYLQQGKSMVVETVYDSWTVRYEFKLENDCNLVLYNDVGKSVWTSQTSGKASFCMLDVSYTGSLAVIGGKTDRSCGAIYIAPGMKYQDSYYALVLTKQGDVVHYGPVIWSTDTSIGHKEKGDIQNVPMLLSPNSMYNGWPLEYKNYKFGVVGCNLVFYDGEDIIWETKTVGRDRTNCFVSMQSDGNLVLYGRKTYRSTSYTAFWSSKTYGPMGSYALVLQRDRNVAIYGPSSFSIRNKQQLGNGTMSIADE